MNTCTQAQELVDFIATKCSFTFYFQLIPLHHAAKKGRYYTAKWLVEHKAQIDSKDNNGVSMTILLIVEQCC